MEQLDPEMLKNLDLLLDMEVVDGEGEWENLEALEEVVDNESDGD